MYHIKPTCVNRILDEKAQVEHIRSICYSMTKRTNSANLLVRESVETALTNLMKEKPFEEITICEIVKKAGVGRTSFYRNYFYKEDVLFSKMDDIAAEWSKTADYSNSNICEKILYLFEKERPILEILYKNNLEYLMYKLIRKYFGVSEEIKNNTQAYLLSFWAGAFFGWCDEWAKRGMKETPEEILLMIKQFDNQSNNNR